MTSSGPETTPPPAALETGETLLPHPETARHWALVNSSALGALLGIADGLITQSLRTGAVIAVLAALLGSLVSLISLNPATRSRVTWDGTRLHIRDARRQWDVAPAPGLHAQGVISGLMYDVWLLDAEGHPVGRLPGVLWTPADIGRILVTLGCDPAYTMERTRVAALAQGTSGLPAARFEALFASRWPAVVAVVLVVLVAGAAMVAWPGH